MVDGGVSMERTIEYKPTIEIYKHGYKVLLRELGVMNFIRFIQQFEEGEGNYTEERHRWLGNYTVDQVVQEIRKRQYSE